MRKLPTRLVDYSSLPDGRVKIVAGELVNEPGSVAGNLDGLSDVVITTPSSTQVLRFDGTNWVNAALAAGDVKSGTFATARLGTGAASASTVLYGDGTWKALPASVATVIDAKGDLIVGSAADAAARLAVGTDGQVLTADAAASNGVKWATPTGGGGGATTLDALSDVTAPAPAVGDRLVWDGAAWVSDPEAVLLIAKGAAVPAGTQAGTLIFEKGA